eukprot:4674761-Prymnesium_polylepis.1
MDVDVHAPWLAQHKEIPIGHTHSQHRHVWPQLVVHQSEAQLPVERQKQAVCQTHVRSNKSGFWRGGEQEGRSFTDVLDTRFGPSITCFATTSTRIAGWGFSAPSAHCLSHIPRRVVAIGVKKKSKIANRNGTWTISSTLSTWVRTCCEAGCNGHDRVRTGRHGWAEALRARDSCEVSGCR